MLKTGLHSDAYELSSAELVIKKCTKVMLKRMLKTGLYSDAYEPSSFQYGLM